MSPQIELQTDVTLNGESLAITVSEDLDGDGKPENQETISVANGTNTYTLSKLTGQSDATYWYEESYSSGGTAAAVVNSIDVVKVFIVTRTATVTPESASVTEKTAASSSAALTVGTTTATQLSQTTLGEGIIGPGEQTATATSVVSGANLGVKDGTVSSATATSSTATASIHLDAPSSVSATVDSNEQITVSWTDNSGSEDNYRIQIDRNGTGFQDASNPTTVAADSTSAAVHANHDADYHSFVGIDSSFQFRVRAETEDVNSSWSSTGTVYTDPLPPHDPYANNRSGTDLDIRWANQADIYDHVECQYRKDTGSGYGTWNHAFTDSDTAHYVSTGKYTWFEQDARYQFRLRSVGPSGTTSRWVYHDYGNKNNVYLQDDFEDQDLAEWTTGNEESGSTSFDDGESGISSGSYGTLSGADQGTYYCQLGDSDYIEANPGDLSGETDVTIRFALYTYSNDASNERATVKWYDGASWYELESWDWAYNREGWVEAQVTVPSSYLGSGNKVRFVGEGGRGGGDHIALDRIVVSDHLHEYTLPSTPSSLSSSTPDFGVISLDWTNNHTTGFASPYYIDIDWQEVYEDGDTNAGQWVSETATAFDIPGSNDPALENGTEYQFSVFPVVRQSRHGSVNQKFGSETTNGVTGQDCTLVPATPTGGTTTSTQSPVSTATTSPASVDAGTASDVVSAPTTTTTSAATTDTASTTARTVNPFTEQVSSASVTAASGSSTTAPSQATSRGGRTTGATMTARQSTNPTATTSVASVPAATAPAVTATASIQLNAPTGVSATVKRNDKIVVSWTDNSGSEDQYHVQMSRDGAVYTDPGSSDNSATVAADSTSVTLTPSNDDPYDSQIGIDSSFQFRVRAETEDVDSTWGETGTVYTDPIPPHNPSITRTSDSDEPAGDVVRLDWANQANIFDHIEVQYRKDTGSGYGSWTSGFTDADTRHWITVNKYSWFTRDARYQFRLRTVSSGGSTSQWAYADYGNEGHVYFQDDFEDQNLSEWDVIGSGADTSDPDPSVTSSTADEGTYSAHLDGEEYLQENLGDLSGETDVLVKLAIRINSMDTGSERVEIQWYDGTAWQALDEYGWAYNDQGWVEAQALVPNSYLSADNRVRFKDPSGWSGDDWWLDRIVISDICHEYTTPSQPSSFSSSLPEPRKIQLDWTNNHNTALPDQYIDVDWYETYEDGDTNGSEWLSESATSYAIPDGGNTPLENGTTYTFDLYPRVEQDRHGSVSQRFGSPSVNGVSGQNTTLVPTIMDGLGIGSSGLGESYLPSGTVTAQPTPVTTETGQTSPVSATSATTTPQLGTPTTATTAGGTTESASATGLTSTATTATTETPAPTPASTSATPSSTSLTTDLTATAGATTPTGGSAPSLTTGLSPTDGVIQASTGTFTTPTAASTVTVDDVGFEPDILVFTVSNSVGQLDQEISQTAGTYGWTFGKASVASDGTITQNTWSVASDSHSTNNASGGSKSGYALNILLHHDGISGRVEGYLSTINTNGFDVTFDTVNLGGARLTDEYCVEYQAYQLADGVDAEVGSFLTPTSTGTETIDLGVKADHIQFTTTNLVNSLDSEISAESDTYGITHGEVVTQPDGTLSQQSYTQGMEPTNINYMHTAAFDDRALHIIYQHATSVDGRCVGTVTELGEQVTIDYSEVYTGGYNPGSTDTKLVTYLAVDTGQAYTPEIGSFTTPTTTGTVSVQTDFEPYYIELTGVASLNAINKEEVVGNEVFGWSQGMIEADHEQHALTHGVHSASTNKHASRASSTESLLHLYLDSNGSISGRDIASTTVTNTGFDVSFSSVATASDSDARYDQALVFYRAWPAPRGARGVPATSAPTTDTTSQATVRGTTGSPTTSSPVTTTTAGGVVDQATGSPVSTSPAYIETTADATVGASSATARTVDPGTVTTSPSQVEASTTSPVSAGVTTTTTSQPSAVPATTTSLTGAVATTTTSPATAVGATTTPVAGRATALTAESSPSTAGGTAVTASPQTTTTSQAVVDAATASVATGRPTTTTTSPVSPIGAAGAGVTVNPQTATTVGDYQLLPQASGDYVDAPALAPSGSFSVSFVIEGDFDTSSDRYPDIFRHQGSNGASIGFWGRNNVPDSFFRLDSDSTSRYAQHAYANEFAEPTRITFVYDDSVPEGRFYEDGTKVKTVSLSTDAITLDGGHTVGAPSDDPADVPIDDFRWYGRALADSEVQPAGTGMDTTGLLLRYLFNEPASATIIDWSGNHNTGTITGSPALIPDTPTATATAQPAPSHAATTSTPLTHGLGTGHLGDAKIPSAMATAESLQSTADTGQRADITATSATTSAATSSVGTTTTSAGAVTAPTSQTVTAAVTATTTDTPAPTGASTSPQLGVPRKVTTGQDAQAMQAFIQYEPIVQTGLDAYWSFDDRYTAGEVAIDPLGTNDAMARGASFGTTGHHREAVSLDGVDDYLAIRDLTYTTQNEITELTVSAWVKLDSDGTIVGFDRSEYYRASSQNFATDEPNTSLNDLYPSTNVADGTWHHIVFWYDADSSGDNKRIYIDNTVDASAAAPHNGNGIGDGSTRYGFIGDDSEASSFDGSQNGLFPTGELDDVRVYHRALSDSEIDQLYTATEPFYSATTANTTTTDPASITPSAAAAQSTDPITGTTSTPEKAMVMASAVTSDPATTTTSGVTAKAASATPITPAPIARTTSQGATTAASTTTRSVTAIATATGGQAVTSTSTDRQASAGTSATSSGRVGATASSTTGVASATATTAEPTSVPATAAPTTGTPRTTTTDTVTSASATGSGVVVNPGTVTTSPATVDSATSTGVTVTPGTVTTAPASVTGVTASSVTASSSQSRAHAEIHIDGLSTGQLGSGTLPSKTITAMPVVSEGIKTSTSESSATGSTSSPTVTGATTGSTGGGVTSASSTDTTPTTATATTSHIATTVGTTTSVSSTETTTTTAGGVQATQAGDVTGGVTTKTTSSATRSVTQLGDSPLGEGFVGAKTPGTTKAETATRADAVGLTIDASTTPATTTTASAAGQTTTISGATASGTATGTTSPAATTQSAEASLARGQATTTAGPATTTTTAPGGRPTSTTTPATGSATTTQTAELSATSATGTGTTVDPATQLTATGPGASATATSVSAATSTGVTTAASGPATGTTTPHTGGATTQTTVASRATASTSTGLQSAPTTTLTAGATPASGTTTTTTPRTRLTTALTATTGATSPATGTPTTATTSDALSGLGTGQLGDGTLPGATVTATPLVPTPTIGVRVTATAGTTTSTSATLTDTQTTATPTPAAGTTTQVSATPRTTTTASAQLETAASTARQAPSTAVQVATGATTHGTTDTTVSTTTTGATSNPPLDGLGIGSGGLGDSVLPGATITAIPLAPQIAVDVHPTPTQSTSTSHEGTPATATTAVSTETHAQTTVRASAVDATATDGTVWTATTTPRRAASSTTATTATLRTDFAQATSVTVDPRTTVTATGSVTPAKSAGDTARGVLTVDARLTTATATTRSADDSLSEGIPNLNPPYAVATPQDAFAPTLVVTPTVTPTTATSTTAPPTTTTTTASTSTTASTTTTPASSEAHTTAAVTPEASTATDATAGSATSALAAGSTTTGTTTPTTGDGQPATTRAIAARTTGVGTPTTAPAIAATTPGTGRTRATTNTRQTTDATTTTAQSEATSARSTPRDAPGTTTGTSTASATQTTATSGTGTPATTVEAASTHVQASSSTQPGTGRGQTTATPGRTTTTATPTAATPQTTGTSLVASQSSTARGVVPHSEAVRTASAAVETSTGRGVVPQPATTTTGSASIEAGIAQSTLATSEARATSGSQRTAATTTGISSTGRVHVAARAPTTPASTTAITGATTNLQFRGAGQATTALSAPTRAQPTTTATDGTSGPALATTTPATAGVTTAATGQSLQTPAESTATTVTPTLTIALTDAALQTQATATTRASTPATAVTGASTSARGRATAREATPSHALATAGTSATTATGTDQVADSTATVWATPTATASEAASVPSAASASARAVCARTAGRVTVPTAPGTARTASQADVQHTLPNPTIGSPMTTTVETTVATQSHATGAQAAPWTATQGGATLTGVRGRVRDAPSQASAFAASTRPAGASTPMTGTGTAVGHAELTPTASQTTSLASAVMTTLAVAVTPTEATTAVRTPTLGLATTAPRTKAKTSPRQPTTRLASTSSRTTATGTGVVSDAESASVALGGRATAVADPTSAYEGIEVRIHRLDLAEPTPLAFSATAVEVQADGQNTVGVLDDGRGATETVTDYDRDNTVTVLGRSTDVLVEADGRNTAQALVAGETTATASGDATTASLAGDETAAVVLHAGEQAMVDTMVELQVSGGNFATVLNTSELDFSGY